MRLSVLHETVYRFDPPMRGVVQSHRLWPSVCEGQQVVEWRIDVDGATRGASFRDGAGDMVETVTLIGPVEEMTVRVQGVVETYDLSGMLKGHRELVPPMAYLAETRMVLPDVALRELAEGAVEGIDGPLDRAHALMQAVHAAVEYTPGETGEATTAAEALALGRGVCQDHAHVMIACAHILDIPARYVTGYLFSGGEGGEGDVQGSEASHAWAELHVNGLGWIGFDAANKLCPDERYIRLGSGADAVDAAPIRGISHGGGDEHLEVKVSVTQAQSQSQSQGQSQGQSQSQQ